MNKTTKIIMSVLIVVSGVVVLSTSVVWGLLGWDISEGFLGGTQITPIDYVLCYAGKAFAVSIAVSIITIYICGVWALIKEFY